MDRRWSYQVPTTTTYCCILKPDNQVLILFPVRTCPVYSFLANNKFDVFFFAMKILVLLYVTSYRPGISPLRLLLCPGRA